MAAVPGARHALVLASRDMARKRRQARRLLTQPSAVAPLQGVP